MALNVTGVPLEFDVLINTGTLDASITNVAQNLTKQLSTPLEKAFDRIDTNLNNLLSSMRKLGSDPVLEQLFTKYADLQKQQLTFQDALKTASGTEEIATLNGLLTSTANEIAQVNKQVQDIDLAGKIEGVKALISSGSIGNELATGFEDASKVVETLTEKLKELNTQKETRPADGGIFLERDIENTERFLEASKANLAAISEQLLSLPKNLIPDDLVSNTSLGISPEAIEQLKSNFNEIDETTQNYITNLIALDTKLQTLKVAHEELSKSFAEGSITEKEYVSNQALIVAGIQDITAKTDELNAKQAEYKASLQNVTAGIGDQAEALRSMASVDFSQLEKDINQFANSGVSGAQKLSAILDGLISKQDRLTAAIQRTNDPELIASYNKGLQETNRQIDMVGGALDGMREKGVVFDEFANMGDMQIQAKALVATLNELSAKQKELKTSISGSGSAQETADYNKQLEETNAQIDRVKKSLEDLKGQGVDVGNFGDPEQLEKTVQAYTRLRQLKQEMASIPAGSDEFKIKQAEAVELQKAIDGVNKGLKIASTNEGKLRAITSGVRGLIGGFQALSGVMTLFGASSAETEAAAKKVIGAMGILQGMQELSAVLDKESAANIFLKSLATKESTAAIVGETVATEANAVATNSASAAQWKLNAAMLANPVGAILGALVALYAAYEVYTRTIGKATDAEKERSAAIEAANEAIDRSVDGYVKEEAALRTLVAAAGDEMRTRKERQNSLDELKNKYPGYLANLSLENVTGEKGNEIIKRQIELIKQKALVQASEEVYGEKLKEQIKLQNEIARLQNGGETTIKQKLGNMFSQGPVEDIKTTVLRNLQKELEDAVINTNAAFDNQQKQAKELADSHLNGADKLKSYIDQLDSFISYSNGFVQSMAKMSKATAEMRLKVAEENKPFDPEEFEKEKKKILENAQYEIDVNKNSYAAKKKLIDDTYDLEIKRIEGLNTGDVEHDKKVAYGKYIAGINALNEEYRSKNYQSEVAAAEAIVLLLQAKGKDATEAFYNGREKVVRASAREQLSQEGITAGEIKRIHAQLALDLANIEKDRITSRMQDQLAGVRAQMSIVKEGTEQELALRIQAISIQSEIELKELSLTENKKNEIRRKAAKEISDLNRSFIFQEVKDSVSVRLATNNALLSAAEKGSKEELDLKRSQIEEKAILDITGANESIKNEQLKLAKIAEINAKALEDKRKLEADYRSKLLQDQLAAIERDTKGKNLVLDLIINNKSSSGSDIAQAQKQKLQNIIDAAKVELNRIDLEIAVTGDKTGELDLQYKDLKAKIELLKVEMGNLLIDSKYSGLKKAVNDIDKLAGGFGAVSQGVRGLNSDLADTTQTLSDIATQAANAVDLFKKMKVAMDAGKSGDAMEAAVGAAAAAAGAVSLIVGVISAAAASSRAALKEMKMYQDSLIVGEIEYNQLLRQRELSQNKLTGLAIQELETKKQLLAVQKQQAQADYDRLLKQIELEGKEITGKKTVKKNAITGGKGLLNLNLFGKKEVVNELADLGAKSYEELLKLFTEGKLDEGTAKWFQQLQKVHDELEGIGTSAEDVVRQQNELFTGTTANSILDSIVQGFADGKRATADFANDFEELMKKSILNSFKYKALEKPIQDFYDSFAAAAESDGVLTEAEIMKLQAQYDAIIKNAGIQFDQLTKLTNIDMAGSDQKNSLKGAIKGMTETQAELLAGQFGGLRVSALSQLQVAQSSLTTLNKIESNTAKLISMESYLRRFDSEGIKIR